MSATNENPPEVRGPSLGSVVAYRHHQEGTGQERFRMGVVVGPLVVDPVTTQSWIGVRIPRSSGDNQPDLIAVSTIVSARSPGQQDDERPSRRTP